MSPWNKQFATITRMQQADMKNIYTTKGSSEGSDNIRPIALFDPLR